MWRDDWVSRASYYLQSLTSLGQDALSTNQARVAQHVQPIKGQDLYLKRPHADPGNIFFKCSKVLAREDAEVCFFSASRPRCTDIQSL